MVQILVLILIISLVVRLGTYLFHIVSAAFARGARLHRVAEKGMLDQEIADEAKRAIDAGISAGIPQFSDDWDAGLSTGTFAVTLCPVWGIGYIQDMVSESNYEPHWDIADIPGQGGSRGGSFYTVPSQSSPEQQAAAWDFLRWLIQPAQQLKVFQATGTLPSQPALYADRIVESYKIEFFNNAPVGPILAKAVTELPTRTTFNVNDGAVEAVLEQVLAEVQAGAVASSDAWEVAVTAASLSQSTASPSPSAAP